MVFIFRAEIKHVSHKSSLKPQVSLSSLKFVPIIRALEGNQRVNLIEFYSLKWDWDLRGEGVVVVTRYRR